MDEHLKIGHNTGFIAVEPKATDFISGGESGILSTPINASGDWRGSYPTNVCQLMKDSQGNSHGDTDACVSFAGCQHLETLLNYMIKTGLLAAADTQWLKDNGYIDSNGSVLFSKRFTAKMSGTDPATGNSLPNVWNSMRNDGVVPEAMWPMPVAEFNGLDEQSAWNVYYAPVPANVIAAGQAFKARFNVQYEWLITPSIPASMAQCAQYLQVSPMEIATAVCNGWNTDDPINGCGMGTQHATLMGAVETDRYDILDHYNPYQKQFASNYVITYAMRGVISAQVAPPAPAPFHYTFTKRLAAGSPTNDPTELHALQQAMQYLGFMAAGVFGPYGPQTVAAVAAFQKSVGIADLPMGTHFGPQTMSALNKRLNG